MKIYRQINSNFHGDVAYVEHDLEPPKPVGFLCCGVFYEMGDIDEFCDREHTLLFTHPTTEPVKAQAGEPVMPAYGQIPWKDLVDAIGEAQGCAWKPDDSYYIGHQPVTINMNSLNRIVSKFTHSTTDHRVPDDVRVVMQMALIVLERHPYKLWQGVTETITALRNALNYTPYPPTKN